MPGSSDLPTAISTLAHLNAIELLDRRFLPDLEALFAALEGRGGRAETSGEVHLPTQPTPFVGRTSELATVRDLLLRDDVRLLTLTGPGGAGKTRLSVEAASALGARYPDGIWFVPLATLRDPGLVVPTIAATLGVREGAGSSIEEALVRHLHDRLMLLVVDNLEQLLPAAAGPLADLIEAAPGIGLIVSSREPLGVRAEHVYPVGELAVGDAEELFAERAEAIDPAFELDAGTRPVVEAICERLEGLPLAIELAAARVKVLSPTEILRRLDDRLPLLAGGARDAPERQRTMRGAIAWSYDLLDDEERRLFASLAVFRGGCSLAAAEEVGGADLDTLGSLVDKSLLRTEERPPRVTRYLTLETIREFAREKLDEMPESPDLRRRHAAWCLALATEGLPGLKGNEQDAWLARLEAEHDNVRTALRWSLEEGDPETALSLAAAFWEFWYLHGDFTEGRSWLAQVLERTSTRPSDARALALTGAGWLAGEQGDPAAPLLEEALDCARGASPATRAFVMTQLMAYLPAERGRVLGKEAVALARAIEDRWVLAIALNNYAEAFREEGDHARATELYEESLETSRDIGDHFHEALCLNNLAEMASIAGDPARARSIITEARDVAERHGDRRHLSVALLDLGWISLGEGLLDEARRWFRESLAVLRELGGLPLIMSALSGLAAIAAAQGDDERAGRLAGAAGAIEDRVGPLPTPPDAGAHVPHLTAAMERAGDRWDGYLRAGRAMDLDAALDYTLA